jgi:hypothetical protein
MGHFNGGSSSPRPFWNESAKIDMDRFYEEWGFFFYYYIYMLWTFERFIGESSVVGVGYPVTVEFHHNAVALV